MGSGVSGYESDSDQSSSDAENGPGLGETFPETDIDVAVAEHQERLRLAALNGGAPLNPTPASARRVSFATLFLVICSITLAASVNRIPKMDPTSWMLAVSSGLLSFLLLVVISRQAQRKTSRAVPPLGLRGSGSPNPPASSGVKNFFQYSLVPWGPAAAIFLHSCLLMEALNLCGFPFALWLGTGELEFPFHSTNRNLIKPCTFFLDRSVGNLQD